MQKGTGLLLFTILAKLLADAGYQWMIFTVTDTVEKLMHRLGFDPQFLVNADPTKITGGVKNWGRYYETQPRVMVGNLSKAVDLVNNRPRLSQLLQQYQKDVMTITGSLCNYRQLLH